MYRIKQDPIRGPYKKDCLRIQKSLNENDCEASLGDCYKLWREMSEETYCAGWLNVPEKNEDIFKILLPYLEKVD